MHLVRNALGACLAVTVLVIVAAEALADAVVPLAVLLVVASLLKWLLEP